MQLILTLNQMKKLVFISIITSGLFSSCGEKSEDGLSYDSSKTSISVVWNDKPLEFTRITNGTIPGGEVTQIWLDDKDYKSKLSLRWGREGFDGPYNFDEVPSISFEFFNNGEKEEYRVADDVKRSDYQIFHDDKRVYRFKGTLNLRPTNEQARQENPEGGTIELDVQKEKRK